MKGALVLMCIFVKATFAFTGPHTVNGAGLPLQDCRSEDIDVLFVSIGRMSEKRQAEKLFSRLVDVFLGSEEEETTRIQFSYATEQAGVLQPVFQFGSYKGKFETKEALENMEPPKVVPNIPSDTTTIKDIILTSSRGNRTSIERVVVVVARTSDPIYSINFEEEDAGVKYCLILYGSMFLENYRFDWFGKSVSVLWTDMSPLKNDHSIAQLLCRMCFHHWFAHDENSIDVNDSHFVSCYFVGFVPNVCVNWLEASEQCEIQNSKLVSIETKGELDFLEMELPWRIFDLQRQNKNYQSNSLVLARSDFPFTRWDDEFATYIGLVRQQESLGKRFQWTNEAPLVFQRWLDNMPLEGSMQGCVFWGFGQSISKPLSSQDRNRKNETEYSLKGWVDIGCGLQILQFYTCEMSPIIQASTTEEVLSRAANKRSVALAAARGELLFWPESGSIISFSAVQGARVKMTQAMFPSYIENTFARWRDFDSLFEEKWNQLPVFNCDDEKHTQIAYSFVCDYKGDCPNGHDELICGYRPCNPGTEITCTSGQCIPKEAECDLHSDCFDGSDEASCSRCQHRICHDGSCLPRHWWYDEHRDCNGFPSELMFADEDMEVDGFNETCLFICNRYECVFESMLNDSHVDCNGPEGKLDDLMSRLEGFYCPRRSGSELIKYPIWSPRCVYFKDRYNTLVGCRDLEHLQGCEHFVCPEGYIKCPLSYCIPIHMVRNGISDCPVGEDEKGWQLKTANASNFECMQSYVRVHPDLVCDGYQHCPRGDDELNCHFSCLQHGLICKGGTIVAPLRSSVMVINSLSFVDYRTRYLDLTAMNLSHIFPARIETGHFIHIMVLLLSGCQIDSLTRPPSEHRLWNELWTVQTLDLSFNLIKELDGDSILRFMGNLRTLNMSHNIYLEIVTVNAFLAHETESKVFESQIRILDLSFTKVKFVSSELFKPLTRLSLLDVRSTGISSLESRIFPADFKLNVLDLRGNDIKYIYQDAFTGVTIQHRLLTDTFKVCCSQVRGAGISASVCSAPSDPLSSCTDLIGGMGQRIFLWVAGTMAIAGNIAVIVYRSKWEKKALKKAYGMFVLQLACSDLLMGVYLILIGSADIYYLGEYIWIEQTWRHSVYCRVAGALATLSSETSIVFILFITVDRFLAIKFPFGDVRVSKRLTAALCLLAWTLGVTFSVIPLLPSFQDWSMFTAYSMCVGLPLTDQKLSGWQFSAAVFIGFNLFMFLIIALGQVIIFRTISAIRKEQGKHLKKDPNDMRDISVARQLFLVAMSDFLCWFPVGVMGILSLSGESIGLAAYAWSVVFILPINSALNPVLYTIPTLYGFLQKLKIFQHSRTSRFSAST